MHAQQWVSTFATLVPCIKLLAASSSYCLGRKCHQAGRCRSCVGKQAHLAIRLILQHSGVDTLFLHLDKPVKGLPVGTVRFHLLVLSFLQSRIQSLQQHIDGQQRPCCHDVSDNSDAKLSPAGLF